MLLSLIFVALCDLAVTFSRGQAISFATPLTEDYYQLFIRNPLKAYNFEAYTEPLKQLCWVFVGIFVIFTPLVLFWITKYVLTLK